MEFKRENHWSVKLMPHKFLLAPLFHHTAGLDPTKRDFNTERRDSHTECSYTLPVCCLSGPTQFFERVAWLDLNDGHS